MAFAITDLAKWRNGSLEELRRKVLKAIKREDKKEESPDQGKVVSKKDAK